MHYCSYCDYKSDRRWDVSRHEAKKHQNQNIQNNKVQQSLEPQLITSYMQGYPQPQSVHHEQVIQHQQPVYQREIPPPPHTQINPQQNALVVRNQYLKNKVNELQTFIRNQNVQTGKTGRKRFRSNNEDDDETSMETDEPPQDFLSESDSEESDIDVGHELEDIITDINISYCNIVGLRKKYLKALEKYNEIEDEDKRDIFKKYVKLKGNLWMDWYDYNEDDEEEENSEDENEESEEEDESEGTTMVQDEGEGEGEEEDGDDDGDQEDGDDEDQEDGEENDVHHNKNHLMDFVLQLESVADKDDKTEIERLWKKQLNGITLLKDAQIDSNETDSENEDGDSVDRETKNINRIKKMIEEFDDRGHNYFKHCNKEKIETIRRCCNELLNEESKIITTKEISKKAKEVLMPVGPNVSILANSEYPISKRRKLLQEVQVGSGIIGALETVVLPFLTKVVRDSIKK